MNLLTAPPRSHRAAVAGYCYPKPAEQLREAVRRLSGDPAPAQGPAVAALVPHGPYERCGGIIGATLTRLAVPQCCLILGANHTDAGPAWSVMAGGRYDTPLGQTAVDEPLAAALLGRCEGLERDETGHRGEHAIEAVLPFLQQLGPAELRIVPVTVNAPADEAACRLGRSMAAVLRRWPEPALVIASCELSHYASDAAVRAADRSLVAALQRMDTVGAKTHLSSVAHGACSTGALLCTVELAAALGASRGTVTSYTTSAEQGGDPNSSTGYAGLVWSRA